MVKSMLSDISALKLTIMGILVSLVGWSFYQLIHRGSSDLLMSFGMINDYHKDVAIIVAAILILWLLGKKNTKGFL